MKKKYTPNEVLLHLEDRFKQVSGLTGDLNKYPVKKEDQLEFKTDKDKSRNFAEVFTPIYIVDEMIETIPDGGMSKDTNQLDLCAGYGQFSIRMLRKLYEIHDGSIDLGKYLRDKHYYAELQISSCYKLLWIFGCKINLAIGDALKLGKLPENWKGIWYFHEGIDAWVDVTGLVQSFLRAIKYGRGEYRVEKEEAFVELFHRFEEKMQEDIDMSIKQIVSTKEGRKKLLEIVNKASTDANKNWQDKATPEWVVREMVNTIPGGVESVKKILVLFNIEFLECLIKEKGVDPRQITFGYDSDLMGLYASSVYKVDTLSIGLKFDELVSATEGCAGKFDVVFSNPPYQVEDGGYGRSARPVYHEIVMHAIDRIQPRYLSMITPSRWMAGGKGLDDYRVRMIADRRIRLIQDFIEPSAVFKTVSIAGGVSYFLWDRDYSGECEFNGIRRYLDRFDIVVRDNTAVSILDKVLAKCDTFCDSRVLPRKPFGLPTNFKDWIPEGTEGAVKCYTQLKGDNYKFVLLDNVNDSNSVMDKWKVHTGRANGAGQNADVNGRKGILSDSLISKPNEVCKETLLVVDHFSTKKEAQNYSDYMKTKFYRFMLSLRLISQDISKQKFAWVPDFGDYSHTYTDQDLYQHFGLTRKEIDHIESTIKELK